MSFRFELYLTYIFKTYPGCYHFVNSGKFIWLRSIYHSENRQLHPTEMCSLRLGCAVRPRTLEDTPALTINLYQCCTIVFSSPHECRCDIIAVAEPFRPQRCPVYSTQARQTQVLMNKATTHAHIQPVCT